MIPNVEYSCPQNLKELLEQLAHAGETGKIIAGGTDVIPALRQRSPRFVRVKKLIDIRKIDELHRVEQTEKGLSIGSGVTFSEITRHPVIQEKFPLLAQAASRVGSVQIRNRATIAGNIVNNAPCADSVPPLLVYNANLVVLSNNGERVIPVAEFLAAPYRTNLQTDEIVTRIELSNIAAGYRGEFYKLGRRRAVAISRITLAVLAKVENNTIEDIRIASGAVTPVAKRFFDLEKNVIGKEFSKELCIHLSRELGKSVMEITGLRYSSAYKLPVVQQMFYQLLRRIETGNR
ncbi:MAG: hypothetical protein GXO74_10940 [Calditrichaeota bacterium]|nr:hypothetical protein [Calditrichota bacterium]